MASNTFTLANLRQQFGLTVTEAGDLFAAVAGADLPAGLADTLARYLPLMVAAQRFNQVEGSDPSPVYGS